MQCSRISVVLRPLWRQEGWWTRTQQSDAAQAYVQAKNTRNANMGVATS